jgi:hypothetical protein
MHAFFYVFVALSLESPLGAIASPIAIADDLIFSPTDSNLFTEDDGASLGTGNDLNLFDSTNDLGDLSGVDSSCPGDLSLGEGGDTTFGLDTFNGLARRNLDDQSINTLSAEAATCGRKKKPIPEPKLELPTLAAPIDTKTTEQRCRDPNRPVHACCEKRNGVYPWGCYDGMLTGPYSSTKTHKTKAPLASIFFVGGCGNTDEYCCLSIAPTDVRKRGLSSLLSFRIDFSRREQRREGIDCFVGGYVNIQELLDGQGYPKTWDDMPVLLPNGQPWKSTP